MRTSLVVLTSAALFILPSLALAQSGDQGQQGECPPGSWFCDNSGSSSTGAQGSEQAPSPDEQGDQEQTTEKPGEARKAAPKVKVYPPDDKGRRVIVVDRPEDVPKPPRPYHRHPIWGVNLRLEGVGMGSSSQRASNSGMAGLGFSFRYRPVLNFAFDAGVDFFGGTDWAGNKRNETAVMLNGIIFFNPRDAVQLYTIGGVGFSGADVRQDQVETYANGATATVQSQNHYSYFGGQLGLGLEFRLTHVVSLNVDALAFIRGRTDNQASTQPEFTDPTTGRTTNTSGGGLLRGGITFYW